MFFLFFMRVFYYNYNYYLNRAFFRYKQAYNGYLGKYIFTLIGENKALGREEFH